MKLEGQVHEWTLFGKTRQFGTLTLPYQEACQLFAANRYSALSAKGEQRDIVEAHVKKLMKAMKAGTYVPTPASCGLYAKHKENLSFKGKSFCLEVFEDNPIPLIDAGHRFEAIRRLKESTEAAVKTEENADVKVELEQNIKELDELPIHTTIYFDGNPQSDFLALQEGRKVDSSHIFSLKLQHKLFGQPDTVKLAFNTAKLLAKEKESPFYSCIRFDSKAGGMAFLPINSLCARGVSDLCTSLIGLARVGRQNHEWLAARVMDVYEFLSEHLPDLIDCGKILAIPANDGRKGNAVMLIGIATCLAYRMKKEGLDEISEEITDVLMTACKTTLDKEGRGNLASRIKRRLMGEFAREFFGDVDEELHEGIPVGLIKALSASTFNVEPLPKNGKDKNDDDEEEVTDESLGAIAGTVKAI